MGVWGLRYRRDVASVDVPVALLGYGTVGSAVDRLLREQAADIERATGHRLRVVRALVRDPAKERGGVPVTTDFAEIRDDPSIAVVAEVMGGLEPAGEHVLQLLRAGKPVVTANKQLVARRGAELFAAADPTEDVSGKDAAAKMAILATVAFGSRVTLEDVAYEGLERVGAEDVAAARELNMVVRLVGAATLVDGQVDVRVRPALVDRAHPLAGVEGAF